MSTISNVDVCPICGMIRHAHVNHSLCQRGAGISEITYTSTQHTMCAVCGADKHTPLRRDDMGGYVCLTCIDKQLTEQGTDIDGYEEETASLRSQLSACQQKLAEATEHEIKLEADLDDADKDVTRLQQQLSECQREQQTFRDELRDSLGLSTDVVWFGAGLLSAAKSAQQQLSECQRELEEARRDLSGKDAIIAMSSASISELEFQLQNRVTVTTTNAASTQPLQQLQQMKEALEQLTIIAELLKDSPDETVVSMGTWEEQTVEAFCQVFTLPEFHAKIKFDLKWLRAARALLSGKE